MISKTSTVTADSRHLTASALVFDGRGWVLLVEHRAYGCWVFPGGHIEEGEDPEDTAVREVLEETGVHIRIVDANGRSAGPPEPFVIYDLDAPAKPHRGEPAHRHVDLLYLADAVDGAVIPFRGDEVSGVRWVDPEDLGTLRVRDDVPELVLRAREGTV